MTIHTTVSLLDIVKFKAPIWKKILGWSRNEGRAESKDSLHWSWMWFYLTSSRNHAVRGGLSENLLYSTCHKKLEWLKSIIWHCLTWLDQWWQRKVFPHPIGKTRGWLWPMYSIACLLNQLRPHPMSYGQIVSQIWSIYILGVWQLYALLLPIFMESWALWLKSAYSSDIPRSQGMRFLWENEDNTRSKIELHNSSFPKKEFPWVGDNYKRKIFRNCDEPAPTDPSSGSQVPLTDESNKSNI